MCCTMRLCWLAASAWVVLLFVRRVDSIACTGLDGTAVDWWVILKTPNGTQAIYTDDRLAKPEPNSTQVIWRFAPNVDDPESPVLLTVRSVDFPGSGHVFYNDEDPSGVEHWDRAHAKGVIGLDASSGYWMLHSVPGYPERLAQEGYPHHAQRFGQTLSCFSFDLPSLDRLAALLHLEQVHVYDFALPPLLKLQLPQLARLTSGDGQQPSPPWQALHLSTSGGQEVWAVGKTAAMGGYLYEDVLEPFFHTGMQVQSWLNGPGALPSFCPSLHHFNSVNIEVLGLMADTWHTRQDHSKWAISMPPKPADNGASGAAAWWQVMQGERGSGNGAGKVAPGYVSRDEAGGGEGGGGWAGVVGWVQSYLPWAKRHGTESKVESSRRRLVDGSPPHNNIAAHHLVCIADANRAASQRRRGGGAVCLQHPALWDAFHQLVVQLQKCWWQP